MNNRDLKIVIDAELGLTVDVSKGENGKLIIKVFDPYSTNYVNPPIPEGYKYVGGEWYNGFVIERCSDGSQFVWIPVGSLDPNGTLDGKHFSEKFGRRNYYNQNCPESLDLNFFEPLNAELLQQFESVKKYGGFYISRYTISIGDKFHEKVPQSLEGYLSWVDITFEEAMEIATTFENNETVKSHLPFGAEYDSIFEWLIKSNSKTFDEVVKDSSDWGYYGQTNGVYRKDIYVHCCDERVVIRHDFVMFSQSYIEAPCGTTTYEYDDKPTITASSYYFGFNPYRFCANNIWDLAGNVREFTQEKTHDSGYCVYRTGCSADNGYYMPAAHRDIHLLKEKNPYTGFRIALCLT